MSLIKDLSLLLHREERKIEKYIYNAPQKYKVYKIPKRTYGYRTIAHPAKELKAYQYAFLKLFDLPYHACSMAYIRNISTKHNAIYHKNNSYLLKMDFKDFFNSITPINFWNVVLKLSEIKSDDFTQSNKDVLSRLSTISKIQRERELIEKILFWSKSRSINKNLMLSIGAPTSPAVSNMYMYLFDHYIHLYCEYNCITYTRYADDLFFSTNEKNILFELPKLVESISTEQYGGALCINQSKTIFTSKKHNRFITGITINNNDELSLGRKRKRYIKHLVYQFTLNNLELEDIQYLNGMLSYGGYIEPSFIQSLQLKYGHDIVQLIKRKSHDR